MAATIVPGCHADATAMNSQCEGKAPLPIGSRYPHRLVHELLHYAAALRLSDHAGQFQFPWSDEIDDRQMRYALDAGLGALLYRATRDRLERTPPAWRDALKSADLTAQVMNGNLCDTADEIVDTCQEMGVRVTLLKGISISDQYYPAPHLRPMGDIDILVPVRGSRLVESALLRRGYSRRSNFQLDEDSYHGVPLFHPERRVWVEVHTGLFPDASPLRRNELFGPSNLAAHSIASTYHGRPVFRLTDELQLVYIASYWIRDMSMHGIHPSFVIPLLDAVYLLKASRQALDWDGLLAYLDNDMAIASLYIMLAYLCRCGFDESASSYLTRLASRQNIVGASEMRIIDFMLDTYLVGGRKFMGSFGDRHPMIESTVWNSLLAPGSYAGKLLSLPWNLVFPPWIHDRYSMGYQMGRIARLLRGRR